MLQRDSGEVVLLFACKMKRLVGMSLRFVIPSQRNKVRRYVSENDGGVVRVLEPAVDRKRVGSEARLEGRRSWG
jgi:hypothetical protein